MNLKSTCLWFFVVYFSSFTNCADKAKQKNVGPNQFFAKNNGIVTDVKTVIGQNRQRDLFPIEFDVSGEKIKLDLVLSKRKVFLRKTPIWLVRSDLQRTPNYTYQLLKNTKAIMNGDFLVDNANKAVIFGHFDHNKQKMLYDGVFGEGSARRIIQSLPEDSRVRPKRTSELKNEHVVRDLPDISDINNDSAFVDSDIVIERNGVSLEKLDKPLEILYPKLLVVIDYHLFKELGKDITKAVRYVATFWNIVDQKYAKLKSPKVKLTVTGVIIANDETALNYVYRSKNETNKADIHEMVEHMRHYFSKDFYNDTSFKNYDAAVLMTGLKMHPINGIFDISGLSPKLGGICTSDNNVAVVTDHGTYSNTLIGTHELGHLLNLSHDYADECDGLAYFFDPLNTSVMTSPTNGSDIFWSHCSLRLLKEFATLKAAKCLATRHRID